jgi:hypothetical protein
MSSAMCAISYAIANRGFGRRIAIGLGKFCYSSCYVRAAASIFVMLCKQQLKAEIYKPRLRVHLPVMCMESADIALYIT